MTISNHLSNNEDESWKHDKDRSKVCFHRELNSAEQEAKSKPGKTG
ncbi:MAG: hypothetical protein GF349_03335 [Candidatus Magasanikbacteria bacterium]|nr:hypothetical protein [Candidatus Magasanikbacteria bacterium]